MTKIKESKEVKSIIRIILVVLALFIYLFTNIRIVQFICLFLLLICLFSKVYIQILQDRISIKRTVSNIRINRQEAFEITLEIVNESFLPVFYCSVNDNPAPLNVYDQGARFCLSLKPKHKTYLSYRIFGDKRGEFFIGPATIEISDPLRIFVVNLKYEQKCRVLIIPAKRDIDLQIVQGNPQGTIIVNEKKYEDLSLYRSIRDYHNGDELKRINWKASAKYNQLFTNEYQNSLDSPVFVYLDLALNNYPSQFRYLKIEEAIENAAAIIVKTNLLKLRNGFASNGILDNLINPFCSVRNEQTENILDYLALIKPVEKSENNEVLDKSLWQLKMGSTFVYVGSIIKNEKIKETLSKFSTRYKILYVFCSE